MLHNVAKHIKVFRQQNLIELQAKVTMCGARGQGKERGQVRGEGRGKGSGEGIEQGIKEGGEKPLQATLNCFNCNLPESC